MLTWRRLTNERFEQARVHVSGARVKAYGRIISSEAGQEPYSASYELLTNDLGVTRRLSVHLIRASGETQLAITRDSGHNWLVQTGDGTVHSDFDGAEDVDIAMSPLFKALPIRRLGLQHDPGAGTHSVPAVYLYLPEGRVEPATMTYTAGPDSIAVVTPLAGSSVTVDPDGFVVDYAGISTRV